MTAMYVVEVEMSIRSTTDVTPGHVTDLIEFLVDFLDEEGLDPDVRASGTGDLVVLTIEVVVEGSEMVALETGVAAINKALAKADVGVDVPTDVHPSLRALEPA